MTNCPICGAVAEIQVETYERVHLAACSACLNPFVIRRGELVDTVGSLPEFEDLRTAAPPDSVMGGVLQTLGPALDALPVLPEVAQRLLALLHDPLSSISDVCAVLQNDSAVSVKMLRAANSALFAGGHQIKDVQYACARLGLKNIANIVFAVSHKNLYKTTDPRLKTFMEELWRHSAATAYCADAIAVATQTKGSDVAFLAGLVHQIGKLVLVDMITNRYKGRLGQLKDSQELLIEVVDRFHPVVGLHTVQFWQLPPLLHVTTLCHETLSLVPDPAALPMTQVVALASITAEAAGFGFDGIIRQIPVDHPAAIALRISDRQLEVIVHEVRERLEEALL